MTTYPMIASRVEWIDVDDDVVSFDGELVHLVSGSGARIWRLLAGVMTTAEIASALSMEYADTAVEEDVVRFVDDLVNQGLVDLLPAPVGNDVRPPAHVAWTRAGDDVVLANLETGERRSLSATGSLVWELLVAGLPEHDVVAQLRQLYPDAGDDLDTDVRGVIKELLEADLLAVRG